MKITNLTEAQIGQLRNVLKKAEITIKYNTQKALILNCIWWGCIVTKQIIWKVVFNVVALLLLVLYQ